MPVSTVFSYKTGKCGCAAKSYMGDTIVTIGRSMHDRAVEYRRPVCGKKMAGKRELHDHKWAHTI